MDTKRQSDRASQGLSEGPKPGSHAFDLAELAERLKARVAKLEGLLPADKVALLDRAEAAEQVTARWMAATGCATPEEYDRRVRT